MSVTTPSATATPIEQSRTAGLWPVVTLGLGIFTLVASEFLPASLLSPIAVELGITPGMAGQLVTATAVAGMVAGPGLVAILPPVDRRWVMAGLTALSVASNLLVAVAPSLGLMLVGRALLGVALSGFWALSLAVVAQLVPAAHLGRAMTVVNTGVSLATVAAVPLGTYIGEQIGWRATFWGVAAAGVVTLVLQVVSLPKIGASERSGLRPLVETLSRRVVATGFAALALLVTAHFAAFTYVRPLLDRVDGLGAAGLAGLLAAFGAAAFAGNLAVGATVDRYLRTVLVVVPIMIAGATSVLAVAGEASVLVVAVAVTAWGLGFGGVPTMVQTWLGRVAPDRLESAGGLTVAVFQISIALGAAAGGILNDVLDVRVAFLAAGVTAAVGALGFSRVRTR
ncbi:MFS transporter [Antribacter sp. KLBMP9083]|uniref:MFS transporter n=1 Tax=Antribacter soli TaxID=2910976 RepID=A0AA41U943_9MICO|nr:MFS transporter [Antribacter soli]MCF4123406.1 MFS transporter [Antribacter soli]